MPAVRWTLWPAIVSIGFAVAAAGEPPIQPAGDVFMSWTRALAPRVPIRVVIENGRTALEAQFISRDRPSSILDAYARTFERHDLDYDVFHPTKELPFGHLVGSIGEEQKQLLLFPVERGGKTLVRATSFKRSMSLRQRYPSWMQSHPELRRLGGRMISSREAYGDEGRSGIFMFESNMTPTFVIRDARSRLLAHGWSERPSEIATQSTGSRVPLASLSKGDDEVTLMVERAGGTTTLVATLTVSR